MTKKEEEDDEIVLTDLDFDEMVKECMEDAPIIMEKEETPKRRRGSVQIQTVEDYFLELGFRGIPRKLHKDFPDLFGSKMDDKNDKVSETPGIEVSADNLLLSSLITVQKSQELKKLTSIIKGIHVKEKDKKVRNPK